MTDYASITDIKQRKLAFLDDTANFYTSKNRAYNADVRICTYSATETSLGCAIGRHLFTDVCTALDPIGNIETVATTENHLIPKWMQDMGIPFLQAMQEFHDDHWNGSYACDSNWNVNGLTDVGRENYEKIKQEYYV